MLNIKEYKYITKHKSSPPKGQSEILPKARTITLNTL